MVKVLTRIGFEIVSRRFSYVLAGEVFTSTSEHRLMMVAMMEVDSV